MQSSTNDYKIKNMMNVTTTKVRQYTGSHTELTKQPARVSQHVTVGVQRT